MKILMFMGTRLRARLEYWLGATAERAFRFAASAALGLALMPLTADATISSVTVNTSRDYENAPGYTFAEITLKGYVARADGTIGQYSVPAEIIFPEPHRSNRVGVVDWINSAFYHFFPPTTEDATFQFTRLATGNYLFEEGYTYVSIQWNKAVTVIFGPTVPNDGKDHNPMLYGSIARSADAWEILLDAARLLKDPSAYPANHAPVRVATVLSSGYSQGAALQLEMLAERRDPARIYDGHLIQMIGLACFKREDVPPNYGFFGDCGPLPSGGDHAPVISLVSESDMTIYHPTVLGFGKSAFFLRNTGDPNWRHYELAGVSHLPATILPLGVANQNNSDPRPAFRAAFKNLKRWTHGRNRHAPPPSLFFEGGVDADDRFILESDIDGHFAGGMRLPHVFSLVHGHEAGAPLGLNAPLNPAGLDPFHPFIFIGGTFTRLSDDAIVQRYKTRREYVARVQRATSDLAVKGYITMKDRKALVLRAREEPLPLVTGSHDECGEDEEEDDDGND